MSADRNARADVTIFDSCLAPGCSSPPDYGFVCKTHLSSGPLAHIGWAIERINKIEIELARWKEEALTWKADHDVMIGPDLLKRELVVKDDIITRQGQLIAQLRADVKYLETRLAEADTVIAKLSNNNVGWVDGAYRGALTDDERRDEYGGDSR